MANDPLGTSLQAWLESLSNEATSTPGQVAGFVTKGGAPMAVPGDTVPFAGAIAASSRDGTAGIEPAVDDGDNVKILADEFGRLWVRVFTEEPPPLFSATTSATGESNHIVAPAVPPAVRIFLETAVYNNTLGQLYIMCFDAAALPVNGTVPTITAIPVCPDTTVSLDLGAAGLTFSNGIVVALSTTPMTLSIAGPTAGSFTIVYR